MTEYFIKRIFYMIIVIACVSVLAFIVINLPPGDYLTSHMRELAMEGGTVSEAQIERLRARYGLDLPLYQRYFHWVKNMLQGDFGRSFTYNRPVRELIIERLPWTIAISLATMVFEFIVAVPIGIFSAVKQYSIGDYIFTVLGFIGLAIPNFLLAIVLMYIFYSQFGVSIGGLFSSEYIREPWSLAKFLNLLKHIWTPIIVIGTAGTAGLIRTLRGVLLDELQKKYVITARAKGLGEKKLLFKYPVRVALNPVFSTLGWMLPAIVSGEVITAIVLNLPTTGPVFYNALMDQDMYLAGSFVMFLTVLTVVGTLVSDLLLVWADPRIRYD